MTDLVLVELTPSEAARLGLREKIVPAPSGLWHERKGVPNAEWQVRLTLKVGDGDHAVFLESDKTLIFAESRVSTTPADVAKAIVGKMGDLVAQWEKQRRIPKGKKVAKDKKGEVAA